MAAFAIPFAILDENTGWKKTEKSPSGTGNLTDRFAIIISIRNNWLERGLVLGQWVQLKNDLCNMYL